MHSIWPLNTTSLEEAVVSKVEIIIQTKLSIEAANRVHKVIITLWWT